MTSLPAYGAFLASVALVLAVMFGVLAGRSGKRAGQECGPPTGTCQHRILGAMMTGKTPTMNPTSAS